MLVWDPVDTTTDRERWPEAGRALSRITSPKTSLPFETGVIGYVGYGAGNGGDPLTARGSTAEPDVWLGRYDGALLFDHGDQRWWATGSRALPEAWEEPRPLAAPTPAGTTTWARPAFERAVGAALGAISAGDIYQLNLTRVVHASAPEPAWAAWRRLRDRADAAYMAWLCPTASVRILSSSPELFLELDGRTLRSVPIKGTRPRGVDAAADALLAAELEADPKERAELTMIVDLVRNDLGRVATAGSVTTRPRALEALPNVLHARQEVTATLRPGLDVWDALQAAFPPGSVTGCPKIRATAWIDRLEPEPRGVYCGAIGFVSDQGPSQWSVAIRTAVYDGQAARWHVGAGIVADSDPASEWAETVAKGRLLARAIAGRDDA